MKKKLKTNIIVDNTIVFGTCFKTLVKFISLVFYLEFTFRLLQILGIGTRFAIKKNTKPISISRFEPFENKCVCEKINNCVIIRPSFENVSISEFYKQIGVVFT